MKFYFYVWKAIIMIRYYKGTHEKRLLHCYADHWSKVSTYVLIAITLAIKSFISTQNFILFKLDKHKIYKS